MHRFSHKILFTLSFLGLMSLSTTAFMQDSPLTHEDFTENFVIESYVQFSYPEGWVNQYDLRDGVAISNSEDALDQITRTTPQLEAGQVTIFVAIADDLEELIEEFDVDRETATAEDVLELLLPLVDPTYEFAEPESFEAGDGAWATADWSAEGFDAVIAIGKLEDEFVTALLQTAPTERDDWRETYHLFLETVHLPEAGTWALTETFEHMEYPLTFAYPENWLMDIRYNAVTIAPDEFSLMIDIIEEFPEDTFFIKFYMVDISEENDLPFDTDANAFEISEAMYAVITEEDPTMEMTTPERFHINDRSAARFTLYAPESTTEFIFWVPETEFLVIIQTSMETGEMSYWSPLIEGILQTLEYHS